MKKYVGGSLKTTKGKLCIRRPSVLQPGCNRAALHDVRTGAGLSWPSAIEIIHVLALIMSSTL